MTKIFQTKLRNILVIYSVLFVFGHFRRKEQCAVYILYFKFSTDPVLLKIRHSHSLRTGSPVKFSKAEIASEASANMRAKRARQYFSLLIFARSP